MIFAREPSEDNLLLFILGCEMLCAWFVFKSQKSQKYQKNKKHVFEIWCVECSSLGPLQISDISDISEKTLGF